MLDMCGAILSRKTQGETRENIYALRIKKRVVTGEQNRLDVRVSFECFHLRGRVFAVHKDVDIFAKVTCGSEYVRNVLIENTLELIGKDKC